MLKYGDKVIIRDGSRLDGTSGIIYALDEERASILLDKEVIWEVSLLDLEKSD